VRAAALDEELDAELEENDFDWQPVWKMREPAPEPTEPAPPQPSEPSEPAPEPEQPEPAPPAPQSAREGQIQSCGLCAGAYFVERSNLIPDMVMDGAFYRPRLTFAVVEFTCDQDPRSKKN
jgi:hypothetical protein